LNCCICRLATDN